jgi:hypothetical protein
MKNLDGRSALIGFLTAVCVGLLLWQVGPGTSTATAAPQTTRIVSDAGADANRAAQSYSNYFPRYQVMGATNGFLIVDNNTNTATVVSIAGTEGNGVPLVTWRAIGPLSNMR